jgi:hypothetical protein
MQDVGARPVRAHFEQSRVGQQTGDLQGCFQVRTTTVDEARPHANTATNGFRT